MIGFCHICGDDRNHTELLTDGRHKGYKICVDCKGFFLKERGKLPGVGADRATISKAVDRLIEKFNETKQQGY